MQQNKRYRYFNQYCLRTPLFPFSVYTALTAKASISVAQLQLLWQDTSIQEAIFLAAPDLYESLKKWVTHPELNIKNTKIQYAFIKYLSRMTTRCTPFGLFAGCTIGAMAAETQIHLKAKKQFHRNTAFDMNLLVALALQLANKPEISKQLLYYPNSSLYAIGNHLRYIEYSYQNSKRVHDIQAVTASTYLQIILEHAKKGMLLEDLAQLLVNDEINKVEALAFVQELVANQLLVSELEPSVCGAPFLEQIKKTLARLKNTTKLQANIQELEDALIQLDRKIGNSVQDYKQIREQVKSLEIPFENKYLFQTDLYISTKQNTLAQSTFDTVKKGICFLNKITPKREDSKLSVFRKAFVARYEQQEIPLALALDIETGLGYPINHEVADDLSLIGDLKIKPKLKAQESIRWDKTREILSKLLHDNSVQKAYMLVLKDSHFDDFEEDWTDLPDTFSAMTELVALEGKTKVYLNSASGTTASNLLGRFSGGNQGVLDYVQTIFETEDSLQDTKIRAEIIHLPQARTGNILKRAASRKFEIPYLAKSNLDKKQQIGIEDLMLSVKGNRIVLRSKKWNKEVLPQLSNAHNYSNGLPIYQFLCDMQGQNLRTSLYFSWGNAAKGHTFLPRVQYDNLILSKASWLLKQEDIKAFIPLITHEQALLEAINSWRRALQMPQYIQLVERDNTLVINLANATSIAVLLTTVQKKKTFVLEEFLFVDAGIVQSEQGHYSNQVVFSFHKTTKT